VTVSVILNIGEYIDTKKAMSKLPGYPWNLNLIKMWKITAFFLTQKVIIVSYNQEMRKSLCRETTNEDKHNLNKQKHGYLIHTWSDKACKDKFVNLTLPSSL